MVWLRDAEAFLVQIRSARLQLTDGRDECRFRRQDKIPHTSIGRELAKDGKILDGLTLPVMLQYFSQYPAELVTICHVIAALSFFETYGAPAIGSLGAVESIATDKS